MNIDDTSDICKALHYCNDDVELMTMPRVDEDLRFLTIRIPPHVVPSDVLNALQAAKYLAPNREATFIRDAYPVYIPQLRHVGTSGESGEFWTFEDETAIVG